MNRNFEAGRAKTTYLLLALPALFIFGCAPRNTPTFEVVRNTSTPQVEVLTTKDQALQALAVTPTEFFVKYDDDTAFWNRSKLFFARYAGGFKSLAQAGETVNLTIVNPPDAAGRFLYRVAKSPAREGYNYRVECAPRDPHAASDLALRNAQNLSRFIQTGTLELDLLDR